MSRIVQEDIEITSYMMVRDELCSQCRRIVKILNYRGESGLRDFDFIERHYTGPRSTTVCETSGKYPPQKT